MKFAELNAHYVQLRGSLRTFVGESALREISVTPPANEDEASFLRLIAWGYALLFEGGGVTVPFMLKLPSTTDTQELDPVESRQLLHDLRTWSFHNLGFSDLRTAQMSRKVSLWFIEHGGSNPPNSAKNWRRCFQRLCSEIAAVIAHCKGAVELVLTSEEDGVRVINDLKRRLDRNWPDYKFDQLVSDCTVRIGRSLDIVRFRKNKIAGWREFLNAIPESDSPETLIARLIERDVLNHFENLLPIDGEDVMSTLGVRPGPIVGEALLYARRLFRTGIHDPGRLLACIQNEFSLNGQSSQC